MPKLRFPEKIYTSTSTACQNILWLIKILKFMSVLEIVEKIHISTFIAC